ncbi:hypothetical protein Q763_17695, partial [Flavobacterium beibuense F44-8]
PNRFYNGTDYRYGFQGQEKDNEIKGEGNSYNFKYRMHDPRIGRFFAVDPLSPRYPHYTPYSFSGNKVIAYGELEGLEERIMIYNGEKYGWSEQNRSQFKSEDWLSIQVSYYKQISFYGDKAVFFGKKEYLSHQKIDDTHYVLTPKTGVLFVDLTGSYPVYEYNNTVENIPHGDKGLIWKAVKKYNPILPQADEDMDFRDKNYIATVENVREASMYMFGGVNFKLSSKALKLLQSSVGEGVMDVLGQALVKGNIKEVDISDAAVQALFKNKMAKNILKSFIDISADKGINIKESNEALTEIGIRLLVDKAPSGDKTTVQKYIIDILKKDARQEIKEAVTGE